MTKKLKTNNNESNLISLCRSCHAKIHSINDNYWKLYFKNKRCLCQERKY